MPDKYYLILEPELVNVCFWYLPTRVRNMPHTAERIKILGEVRPMKYTVSNKNLDSQRNKASEILQKARNKRMICDSACVFRFVQF